ncbi:MAG TPA: N-acetyltransferase [Candidatus Altiarchaeales archaeon]|nr:N-acetyltransferase [Candidatus Altiarchaeales archaeon]
MEYRRAGLSDVEQIYDLVYFYAGKNLMLVRSRSYLYENLRDFFVAVNDSMVVGCGSLHITWNDLAEVKSLAVDPRFVKKGVGAGLLKKCLEDAKSLGVKKVFTLTLEPEFFEKNGFKRVDKNTLPMKIWGECSKCPKYPNCDEIALVLDVDGKS